MCTLSTAWNFYEKNVLSLKTHKSRVSESGRWKHIVSYLDAEIVKDITPIKIMTLTTALKQIPLSPQSVRHCLSLLQRVLIKARKMELYKGHLPSIEFPHFDNKRVRFLTKREARLLLAALKDTSQLWHDIAYLALFTGLRAGEIFRLRAENFDNGNKLLHILDTKTSTDRSIPLTPQVCKLLRTYLAKSDGNPHLFHHDDGKQINQVSKKFREAVDSCNLNKNVSDRRNKIVFHSLRHTFASWLVQEGTQLQVVGRLLGHANLQMTMRYAHLAPDQGAKAVAKLRI